MDVQQKTGSYSPRSHSKNASNLSFYLQIDSPEWIGLLEQMNGGWTDPRQTLREVCIEAENRRKRYALYPNANPDIIRRNTSTLERLLSVYVDLYELDLPTYKLCNDLIKEARKVHPNAGCAIVYIPLRLHGNGEPIMIDLCTKSVV